MKKKEFHSLEFVFLTKITGAFFTIFFAAVTLWYLIYDPREERWIYAIAILFVSLWIFAVYLFLQIKRLADDLNAITDELDALGDKKRNGLKSADLYFECDEIAALRGSLFKLIKKLKKKDAKITLKNRQRADMLSAIAHEFRNPIAAIVGYAQTLYEEKEISQELQNRFLYKIRQNGLKIESLLSRLLLWNKLENKQMKLQFSEISLRRLCNEVLASLLERYKGRSVEIVGEDQTVRADKALLEIALKNLIENALKYSDDTVEVHLSKEHICVVDKGAGIAPEEIEKITKKFYRSGKRNWDNSMGLGLTLVKRIARMHGMSLDIRSKPNQGSRFCIRFNIHPTEKNVQLR